jgi:Cu/Ag efflux protein CusF
MRSRRILSAAALAVSLAWPIAAQEKMQSKEPKTMGGAQVSSITATVEAIDTANRVLTLKDPDGNLVDVEVPDSVKRFSEIKVGDKLSFRYTEALVLELRKADPAAKLGMTVESGIERKQGEKPGAVVSRTITATVEVVSTDMKAPSITVRSADGNTHSFRVQDVKNLEGVKAGDHIVVTYKEALAIQVSSPAAAPAK